jgi:HSP20 family protein
MEVAPSIGDANEDERRVAMTANKELARATAPLGLFEPRMFAPRWLREFDRLFTRDFPFTTGGETFETAWVPEMEVFEKNNVFTVRLDVPGLKREELTVHVAEGVLTVEGERKHETEEEKNHWYRRERTYGRFYRTVPLPEGVNAHEVKATFAAGVLEVTVPMRAAAAPVPHKVEVHGPEEKVTVTA